jgi:hypothetical protein
MIIEAAAELMVRVRAVVRDTKALSSAAGIVAQPASPSIAELCVEQLRTSDAWHTIDARRQTEVSLQKTVQDAATSVGTAVIVVDDQVTLTPTSAIGSWLRAAADRTHGGSAQFDSGTGMIELPTTQNVVVVAMGFAGFDQLPKTLQRIDLWES